MKRCRVCGDDLLPHEMRICDGCREERGETEQPALEPIEQPRRTWPTGDAYRRGETVR